MPGELRMVFSSAAKLSRVFVSKLDDRESLNRAVPLGTVGGRIARMSYPAVCKYLAEVRA